MDHTKQIEALDVAISHCSTQAALATSLGIRQSVISMWKHRKSVPAEHCPAIERATGGRVRCEDLRPDVDWSVLRKSA